MTDIQSPSSKTKDLIQTALSQSVAPSVAPIKERIRELISTAQVRDLFKNALAEHADSFLASIVELYQNDKLLQSCSPSEVILEAFKAATLRLPINKQLGFCYILPYKDNRQGKMVPTFQLGYKGYIQLCMRTGAYRRIHAGPVYEGEFVSENRLTGEIDLSGKRTSDKVVVVGYSAYLETISGFSKALYWPIDKMVAHAKRYSKSYGSTSSPWTTNFDEMSTKVILKSLISRYSILSVELQQALVAEISTAADEQLKEVPDERLKDAPDAITATVAGDEVPATDIA